MADDKIMIKIPLPLGIALEGDLFSFLRRYTSDVSIFLYGAQGTGKTSFIRALSDASSEDLRSLGRTTHVERGKLRYNSSNPQSPCNLVLSYSDSPGDKDLRSQSFEKISKYPPIVTLVFLDHFDTRKKLRQDFQSNPNPTEHQVRAWEISNISTIGKPDNARIKENRNAIIDLQNGFSKYSSFVNRCCLIVPVMTKYDLWKEFYHVDYFVDIYDKCFARFRTDWNITVTKVMPCSSTINIKHSLHDVMRLIDTEVKNGKPKSKIQKIFGKG